MQITRVSDRINNQSSERPKKSSGLKTGAQVAVWTLGALGAGSGGFLLGHYAGEKCSGLVPMDKELLSEAAKLNTEFNNLSQEAQELRFAIKQTESELAQAREGFAPVIKDVFHKAYEQVYKILELPVEIDTEKPNSVMIQEKSKFLCEEFIDFIKMNFERHQANTSIVKTIDLEDGILKNLKKAKTDFEQTKKYTILHVKNFENSINQNSRHETIAGMKSILGNCSRLYNSIVLFSATNPDNLDKIAIGPHRVSRVELEPLVQENHRPLIDCYEKATVEHQKVYSKLVKNSNDFLELANVQQQNEIKQNMYKLKKELKFSVRGSYIGASLGVLGIGALILKKVKSKGEVCK